MKNKAELNLEQIMTTDQLTDDQKRTLGAIMFNPRKDTWCTTCIRRTSDSSNNCGKQHYCNARHRLSIISPYINAADYYEPDFLMVYEERERKCQP